MTEEVLNTAAQADETVTGTDTESASQATTSEAASTAPSIEMRDGKLFLDGTRVYTRDDTNRIASNAKNEAINGLLRELDVDSLDQVKEVITTLKSDPITEAGENSLDVQALRQAVQKREATVEELQAQVNQLKTDLLLKDHLGNLNSSMPSNWNADQKAAVMDLMKARGMFAIENNSFQLRNGDEFLTVDGERPDYNSAVELVGKSLGLPFGKKGVDVVNTDSGAIDGSRETTKAIDNNKLNSDAEYRAAYTQLRKNNPQLSREQITHNMIMKKVEVSRRARGA